MKNLTDTELQELKSKAMDVLTYTRQQLLNRHPFVGHIALMLDLVPIRDNRCDTAATDGDKLYFDIDFLSRLSQEERVFVFGHEVWHCALTHLLRGESRDKMLWNVAADLEVNQLLESDGMVAPQMVLFPNLQNGHKSQFNFDSGLSAEEYYGLLCQNGAPSDGDGSGDAQGKSKRQSKSNPVQGQFDSHLSSGDFENAPVKAKSDKYGAKGQDADFAPSTFKSDKEKRDLAEKMRSAIVGAAQNYERMRGDVPGAFKKLVQSLLEPKMPWRELLASFMSSAFSDKCTWSVPNRRFAYSGTYLPSHANDALRIAVGIDTSGSCAQDCEKFLTELVGIAKSFCTYELHLVQCDTEVKSYELYNEENPLDPTSKAVEFQGFGGTRLHPIFEYLDAQEIEVDALVIFTDGECERFTADEKYSIPTLWAFTGNPKDDHDNIEFGTKLHIED